MAAYSVESLVSRQRLAGNAGYQLAPYLRGASCMVTGANWQWGELTVNPKPL